MRDGVIDDLRRFMFERLAKPPQPANGKPCMSEDWWIEDARSQAPNWLSENDLRRIWRVARMQRIGLERGAGCPWLLLHQMTDLFDAMFGRALSLVEPLLSDRDPEAITA